MVNFILEPPQNIFLVFFSHAKELLQGLHFTSRKLYRIHVDLVS